MLNIELSEVEKIISFALAEDIGDGDITTDNIIGKDEKGKAEFVAKEDGVIAGLPIAELVFLNLDPHITWKSLTEDGSLVKKGDKIAEFEGSLRALLTGERTALNFLQRMSGIATLTHQYAEALEGTKTKLLDTRKTVPGLRLLDKYAVKAGGGTNHRIGLYDMVMIKDNHISAAGGIKQAVEKVRPRIARGVKIEVETTNLAQVNEALQAKADIIMLDNMTTDQMTEAVKIIDGHAKVEASGNMNIKRLKEVASAGVDFISVGALTHSVQALDISQYIKA